MEHVESHPPYINVHQSNLSIDEGHKILGVKAFRSFVPGSLP
jgi:hypothetical protein